MPIDIAPETERLVREEIRSGHFNSVDEIIQAGVEAWREKHTPPTGEARPDAAAPFWKTFTGRLRAVPPEVFDSLPADGASEHDHYLYGTPKRNP